MGSGEGWMKQVCYVSIFSHAKTGKRELVRVYLMNAYTFYFSFSVIRAKENELMKVTKTCVGRVGFVYCPHHGTAHVRSMEQHLLFWNNTEFHSGGSFNRNKFTCQYMPDSDLKLSLPLLTNKLGIWIFIFSLFSHDPSLNPVWCPLWAEYVGPTFIYSMNKYLLTTNHVSGTVPGAGKNSVKQQKQKCQLSWSLQFTGKIGK